jgi:hypothetical protein
MQVSMNSDSGELLYAAARFRRRRLEVSFGFESDTTKEPRFSVESAAFRADLSGRGDWIRTSDPLTPSQVR